MTKKQWKSVTAYWNAGTKKIVNMLRTLILQDSMMLFGLWRCCLFFASTFSSKMQIDFLKVAWGISPVLHFPLRHSFGCRRGAVAGIQSLLVTDM